MVNFKQMVGLITLSAGIILMIYALRSTTGDVGAFTLTTSGTFFSGATLLGSGILLSLYMNK